jgi:hypothetical protein
MALIMDNNEPQKDLELPKWVKIVNKFLKEKGKRNAI